MQDFTALNSADEESRQFRSGGLATRYHAVRGQTEKLCEPLCTEDYVVQSMPDVSPAKWHLAHTSWFFETFLLTPLLPRYRPYDERFFYLFNSYYVTVGDRHCRQHRGLVTRPTVAEVYSYRQHIDRAMIELLSRLEDRSLDTDVARATAVVELGLNHEQQHQELLLTDLKHVFWVNPLRPAYAQPPRRDHAEAALPLTWRFFEGGIAEIGHAGPGFAFDNEMPRHKALLATYELASRLVTNGEYKEFIAERGYSRPELWLSLGAATVEQEEWEAPLYWIKQDGEWLSHTLFGMRPIDDAAPVCHLSYFEADAFARWSRARLPTEFEWEASARGLPLEGHFVESNILHPEPANASGENSSGMSQMFGELWQWTASAYLGYPGYRPPEGAIGEYNGKFMCNQFVLRGGSLATPRSHIRASYRNFFPPDARWQFSGLRLARDAAQ